MNGWNVGTAYDGVDALEQLQEGLTADVVIADYMMPRLDGLAMIDQIK